MLELKQSLRFPLPHAAGATWLDHATDADAARRAFILRLCRLAAQPAHRAPTHGIRSCGRRAASPGLGLVCFRAMVLVLFWAIFSLAKVPMGWIESGQGAVAVWLENAMPAGDLRSLLIDGVLGGVGGVVMFLPQIVLLFFFIGLLESTGYMARAAFLMDGLMARAGLSGKAFLPLFSSYACAIPGVMATRTIDSAKERLVTIFVAPWMSCSARLPVYLLIVPLLLHETRGSWRQALVLFAIYALGTGSVRGRAAVCAAASVRIRSIPISCWKCRRSGCRGGATSAATCWTARALSPARRTPAHSRPIHPAVGAQHLSETRGRRRIRRARPGAMGRIGAVIEPVVKPLGFDGRTGTAVLTSFAAREVFNSSMAILFRVDEGRRRSGHPRPAAPATRRRHLAGWQTVVHAAGDDIAPGILHLRPPVPAHGRRGGA